MIIYGKERKFRATVGAMAEIAQLCPGGDLGKLDQALTGSFAEVIGTMAKVIVALNKGYESAMRFEAPELKQDPLTVDEVLSLTQSEIALLQAEAKAAMAGDVKTQVDAEPLKKTKE